jgi:Cdc6-like AAA superfamily ATPase
MNKTIMLGVSKMTEQDVIAKYGDETLAVVVKNDDGKKTFFIPKIKDSANNIEIALSKRDLKELLKIVKDNQDDDCVEIKLLLVKDEAKED